MNKKFAKSIALLLLLTLIATFSLNSCKKNAVDKEDEVSKLDENDKITNQEIADWLRTLPSLNTNVKSEAKTVIGKLSSEKLPFTIRFDKAQQSVVKGNHIVRVPISKDAFLILSKDSETGKVSIYGFRTYNEKPNEKKFSGQVGWINFQDHKTRVQYFKNGKIGGTRIFKEPASGKGNTTSSFWDFLERAFCFLTFGTWIDYAGIEHCERTGFFLGTEEYPGGGAEFYSAWSYLMSSGYNYTGSPGGGDGGGGNPGSGGVTGGQGGTEENGYVDLPLWLNYYVDYDLFMPIVEELNNLSTYVGGLNDDDKLWLSKHNNVRNALIGYLYDTRLSVPNKQTFAKWVIANADNNGYTNEEFIQTFLTLPEDIDGTPDPNFAANYSVTPIALPGRFEYFEGFPKIVVANTAEPDKSKIYPMNSQDVYTLVGGSLDTKNKAGNANYQNACAIRGSRGLNFTTTAPNTINPFLIPEITGVTEKGANNLNYIVNAKNFNTYMNETFGAPTASLTGSALNSMDQIKTFLQGKTGIYTIVNNAGSSWSGHVDYIINGRCLTGTSLHPPSGIAKIEIWELAITP